VKTFRLRNLGCKVNQYEGEAVAQMLADAGIERVSDGDGADLVLVNTCTVTASAAAKGRKAIRAERRNSPRARLVVTGCMAEKNSAELSAMSEIDLVVPNREKGRVLAALGVAASGLDQDDLALARPTERTRAYVRVQDGCEQRCSYCVLPEVRGRERSRPAALVLEEIGRLADAGVGEIVLCGIHLGRYGREPDGRGEDSLTSLVRRALELPGNFRLRLSSVEIGEVTNELVGMLGRESRMACHLHLPLQSGSDRVLEAMRRPYTRSEFLAGIERIRGLAGDIGITTDVIVGFPGESDGDFAETVSCLEAARPHRVHRFVFSPREGTPAALMDGAVDTATAGRRMDALAELGLGLTREFASSRIGRDLDVIAEPGREPGSVEGYSSEYLRVKVAPAPRQDVVGKVIGVRPEKLDGTVLVGPAASLGMATGKPGAIVGAQKEE